MSDQLEAAASETRTATPLLAVRDLEAGYGETTVLRDVSLTLPSGSVLALLGPNGAGKTTLLQTLAGFVRPTKGEIAMDGEVVTASKPHERARRGLCLVPEGRGIYPSLTVRENLVLHTWRRDERGAVERAVQHFPILGEKLHQQAGLMSGGQQQMLAVARAYIDQPRLVLVDEVSMGLAPVIVDQIYEFLGTVVKEGTSLLLVEQYVSRALGAADRVMILAKGSVVFEGPPSEVGQDVFDHYLGSAAGAH